MNQCKQLRRLHIYFICIKYLVIIWGSDISIVVTIPRLKDKYLFIKVEKPWYYLTKCPITSLYRESEVDKVMLVALVSERIQHEIVVKNGSKLPFYLARNTPKHKGPTVTCSFYREWSHKGHKTEIGQIEQKWSFSLWSFLTYLHYVIDTFSFKQRFFGLLWMSRCNYFSQLTTLSHLKL